MNSGFGNISFPMGPRVWHSTVNHFPLLFKLPQEDNNFRESCNTQGFDQTSFSSLSIINCRGLPDKMCKCCSRAWYREMLFGVFFVSHHFVCFLYAMLVIVLSYSEMKNIKFFTTNLTTRREERERETKNQCCRPIHLLIFSDSLFVPWCGEAASDL